jgi:hypothetical protein
MTTGIARIGRRALAAAAGLALPAVVRAQGADMAGRTIEWIVPFPPGGGTDTWARFHHPFLQRHMRGQPTIVIRNVPGAGGLTGTNQFAARAQPDGLSFLATTASIQFPFLLGDRRVRYDYAAWTPLVAGPTGGVVYVRPELGVRGPGDLGRLRAARDLRYASQGATTLDLVPALAFEMLGLEVQIVFGIVSRAVGRLSFERGETPMDYQTTGAYLTQVVPLVQRGQAVPLFSWGILDAAGGFVRDPNFPDLPHFAEFLQAATGSPPSGDAWEAMKVMLTAGFAAQKFAVLPRATPAPIVETYRAAYRAMFRDAEYLANRGAAIGEYDETTDAAAEAAYRAATTIAPEARAWIQAWLARRFNVTL